MRQLDLTERLLRLREVPVFRGMATSDLAPLAATMRSARFEKGEIVLREDQPPQAFHMLLTGSVTMRRRGRQLRTITAPGGVGFLSLLARTGGGTEAVADTFSETFELRADAIYEMFEDHFFAVLGTMRWVAEQLIQENRAQPPPPYTPPGDGFDQLVGDRELGIVERIFLLRRTRAFKAANVNSTARLARRMKEIRQPAGATIWSPSDRADGSIFIVKGKMNLTWDDPKGGTKVQEVGPGYIVGGAESIAGLPRWNQLVTAEPALYLHGSREALIDMFEDDLEVSLQFLSMMANFLLTIWDAKAEAAVRADEDDDARDSSPPAPAPAPASPPP